MDYDGTKKTDDSSEASSEYMIRRQSDKHSSGYDSERDMDITPSQSGSWDSRRSSLAPVEESHREDVFIKDPQFSPRDPMPGTSKLTKNGAKIQEESFRLTLTGDEFSQMLHRSPLQSRRFSQVHAISHVSHSHFHKPRSKDDSDLIVRKERSILLSSRGRELKMMQTDFHKKRPHLWKHSSNWSQTFRNQCSVLETTAFNELPSTRQLAHLSISVPRTHEDDSLEKTTGTDSYLSLPITIKTEPDSGGNEDMKSLSPVCETDNDSIDVKPSVPIVTVHTPGESTTSHEAYFRPLKPTVDRSPTDQMVSKHINFKKFLQHKYLSSLQDSISTEDDASIDSTGDPHEGSIEREIFHSSGISIEVDKPDDDDCLIVDSSDQKDDNEVFTFGEARQHQLSQYLARQRLSAYRREYPVDLSSPREATTHPSSLPHSQHSEQYSDDLYLSACHHSPHLSPTMMLYQRNLPLFYSPKQELLSPRSPLSSVPEGHVFNFSVPNSPFDTRPHSDPEFVSSGFSPAFSPDSPVQFTFPSKAADMGDSRMPKSPRLMFTKSRDHISPSKQLSKLYRSPPPAEQLLSSESLVTGDLSYVCPICGQVFPTYDNLAKHMAKHLPTETIKSADNNKIHYCRICERAFSRSDMLTRHMRLHTGLKPYECRVCGQVFSRSDHLNTHQRTHTGVKPYRCPQCPYAACRRDMITRHMRIHTKRSGKRNDGNGTTSECTSIKSSSTYLSIHDQDKPDSRKASASSVDSLRPKTCSISSIDSLESEPGSRKHSLTSLESFERDQRLVSFQRSSTESTDIDEGIGGIGRGHSSRLSSLSHDTKYLDPYASYRTSRNWSMTSMDSLDSETTRSESISKSEPGTTAMSTDYVLTTSEHNLECDIEKKINLND